MADLTPDQVQALAAADVLIAAGVPVFVAAPDDRSAVGYKLPKGWQDTPVRRIVTRMWRPGMALCAVMGHGLDLVDLDPRNGGTRDSLNGTMPRVYGVQASPSDGEHLFVASMGVRSRDGVVTGVDVKAGDRDGVGRGFAFIAPTVRASKVTGELVAYRWTRPPRPEELTGLADDTTGRALADLVRQAHQSKGRAANDGTPLGGPWDDVAEALSETSGGRRKGTFRLASALRGRGGWRVDDALRYMRTVVWPVIDQTQGGHPFTEDEFVTAIRDAFDRYDDGPGEEYKPSCDDLADLVDRDTAVHAGRGLPDEFWTRREWLDHLRRAAWSRGCSAEAVLGAALARLAAMSSHFIKLPAPVGARVGLTQTAALVGPPGSTKSSSVATAVDLLPIDESHAVATTLHALGEEIPVGETPLRPECDEVQVGSGEGLVDVLFDLVDEDGPAKGHSKPRKVKQQTRFNAYVYVDEGETLARQARRNGQSTVLPTIRTAFTDGPLGQSNAAEERKRRVPRGQYVFGIVLGIQPAKAEDLFSDAGAGTPQRLYWMPADADVPPPGGRPEWPGPLRRRRPPQVKLDVVDEVADEIRWNHHLRRTGCDPLDEHADLIRFKIAGVFAVMDAVHVITEEHWSLAREVMACSDRTRARLQAEVDQQRQQSIRSRGEADAVRAAVVDERTDERATAAATRQAVARVLKHHQEHPEGTCPRRCVTQAIASKYRERVSVPEVLARAVAGDLLDEVDGRYRPGRRTAL